MTTKTHFQQQRTGTNLVVRIYSDGDRWYETQTSLRGKRQPLTGYEYTRELAGRDVAMDRIEQLRRA